MLRLTALDTIDTTLAEALRRGMNSDSAEKGVPLYKPEPYGILAHDNDGTLIGGLSGETVWDWLYLGVLWVRKEFRKQGVGRSLVERAEALGKKRGCHSAYVWTESFQSPGFYERVGYTKFVVQEDCPMGHQRIGLSKKLGA